MKTCHTLDGIWRAVLADNATFTPPRITSTRPCRPSTPPTHPPAPAGFPHPTVGPTPAACGRRSSATGVRNLTLRVALTQTHQNLTVRVDLNTPAGHRFRPAKPGKVAADRSRSRLPSERNGCHCGRRLAGGNSRQSAVERGDGIPMGVRVSTSAKIWLEAVWFAIAVASGYCGSKLCRI